MINFGKFNINTKQLDKVKKLLLFYDVVSFQTITGLPENLGSPYI
jgi:hypothetical protein